MMIKHIIKQEEELQNTLKIIKDLIEEHNIFPLKGMIEQLDKLISNSEFALLNLRKWENNNKEGDSNAETNQSTT